MAIQSIQIAQMDPLKGEMLLVSEMLAEEEDMPRVQDCIVHNMLKRRRRTFLARGHRIDQLSFLLFPMVGSRLSSRLPQILAPPLPLLRPFLSSTWFIGHII